MRNPTTTSPRLRIRREALRQLAAADLRQVGGASQKCMSRLA